MTTRAVSAEANDAENAETPDAVTTDAHVGVVGAAAVGAKSPKVQANMAVSPRSVISKR